MLVLFSWTISPSVMFSDFLCLPVTKENAVLLFCCGTPHCMVVLIVKSCQRSFAGPSYPPPLLVRFKGGYGG